MMRDELLRRISGLPAETDIGVRVGDGHLDITDVITWDNGDRGALTCHPPDLRDLLREWDLPDATFARITHPPFTRIAQPAEETTRAWRR
ncbi:hypothetical protein BJ973_003185 [Actinoplanes tereljensis]|nr:hypothetical protein [Actinoplanes tereljensis]